MQRVRVERVKGPPISHWILHGFSKVESVTWLSILDTEKVHNWVARVHLKFRPGHLSCEMDSCNSIMYIQIKLCTFNKKKKYSFETEISHVWQGINFLDVGMTSEDIDFSLLAHKWSHLSCRKGHGPPHFVFPKSIFITCVLWIKVIGLFMWVTVNKRSAICPWLMHFLWE